MSIAAKDNIRALTEREKQTLRMIVRGHDAKSIARSLGLSVYTINERLRDARRKLAVSSSREAARLLLEVEGDGLATSDPQYFVPNEIGRDLGDHRVEQDGAPIGGAGRPNRRPWILAGAFVMIIAAGLLALTVASQGDQAQTAAPAGLSAAAQASDAADFARNWLALIDQGRWKDSYAGTSTGFQKLNTLAVWTDASEQMRSSLGAEVSRAYLGEEDLPAPPHGYHVVKFRSSFTQKANAVETVTLDREGGAWRVVGVMIE